jgi:hypothetical protein
MSHLMCISVEASFGLLNNIHSRRSYDNKKRTKKYLNHVQYGYFAMIVFERNWRRMDGSSYALIQKGSFWTS